MLSAAPPQFLTGVVSAGLPPATIRSRLENLMLQGEIESAAKMSGLEKFVQNFYPHVIQRSSSFWNDRAWLYDRRDFGGRLNHDITTLSDVVTMQALQAVMRTCTHNRQTCMGHFPHQTH